MNQLVPVVLSVAETPPLWSWPVVIASSAVLVSLGKLIDWLFRERQKTAILLGLRNLENKLKNTPIRIWQAHVAGRYVGFVTKLGPTVFGFRVNYVDLHKRNKPIPPLEASIQRMVRLRVYLFCIAPMIVFIIFLIYEDSRGSVERYWNISLPSIPWYVVSLSVPVFFFLVPVFIIVVPLILLMPLIWTLYLLDLVTLRRFGLVKHIDARFETPFRYMIISFEWTLNRIMPMVFISTCFTVVATIIGLHFSHGHHGSYWFAVRGASLVPSDPITLAVLNFPFDFLTILISRELLKWVISKGRWISVVAVIDILISGMLALTLHSLLKAIESGQITTSALVGHLTNSWNWLASVMTLQASSTHPDWPLTPLILTAFIPVSTYMSVLILLGISGILLRIAGYICGLLGEKQHTPFFELAVALSLLTTAAKGVTELMSLLL